MFSRSQISFRSLETEDLPRMLGWLRSPEVGRWYAPAPSSMAEVESKYLTRISGMEPVHCYIAEYGNAPVAYLQTYRIDHDAEYAAVLSVDRDAYGIDLFIGEAEFRYRGFGSIMLQEFVRSVVFGEFGASCCVIAPSVRNTRAIRAYQKAGFRHTKTANVPGEADPEHVMLLWPDEIDRRIAKLEEKRDE